LLKTENNTFLKCIQYHRHYPRFWHNNIIFAESILAISLTSSIFNESSINICLTLNYDKLF